MEKYLDSSLSARERAKDLLGRMSLDEKMGQITGFMPFPGKMEQLEKKHPHGVGAVSCLWMMGFECIEEAADFQKNIQKKVMELSEHHIPAVFHLEGLSGALLREAPNFPSGIGRGAAWDPGLEYEIGRLIGREAAALGVTQVFAPVLDVTRDARFGRHGESYGEDPVLVSALGCAYAKGIHDNTTYLRPESTAKHFLGYHASPNGIHATSINITGRELREVYGKPFQAAISEAGLKGIMPAYSSINGEPISGSKSYLTDLLRTEMGFDGLTVSDYTAIWEMYDRQKVATSLKEAGLRALKAGMDIELPNCQCCGDELKEMFASGEEKIEVLDRAVMDILEAKFRMGLFENPFAMEGSKLREMFYKDGEEELPLLAAQESMVLLKNDGILPLKKENYRKIAVIGYHADKIHALFGGYTYVSFAEGLFIAQNTMAGVETGVTDKNTETYPGSIIQIEKPEIETGARRAKPEIKSLLEVIKDNFADSDVVYEPGYDFTGNDTSRFARALKLADESDLVILTLGGKYGTGSMSSMGEGIDNTSINLPECQELFLRELSRINTPKIAIHFDGRPISSDCAQKEMNAILEAWTPADRGAKTVVSILTGQYNPGGKLPVTVAYNAGQEPLYYNHSNGSSWHQNTESAFKRYVDVPHEPRYCFGYGLSYTEYSYTCMEIDRKEIKENQPVHISAVIKNTGNRDGVEIVQLYVQDRCASVLRPNMELAGFVRVPLKAGESRKVIFDLWPDQLGYIGSDKKWILEAGEVEILLGASSEDIRLKDSIKVIQDIPVDERNRKFYASAKINTL